MGDIYVRILARLEAPLLQRHCSLVFNDELDAIRVEIKEIMTAYERLQEVREAVASLENGRTDVSRSASLMDIVGSTAQLQDELARRVKMIETTLLSRPVVKTDEEKPNAKATAEDATMEQITPAKYKPSKEDKPKRKRRESVSETAPRVVDHEESDQETTKETSVAPVKKKKTKKATTKHESAALEATASHKLLLSSSWSSTASTGGASGSETESEGEDQMTASMDMDDDHTSNTNAQLSYDQWAEMVHKASGRAQRVASGNRGLSLHDVTPLVESLCELLATARVPPGSSYSRLVKGQFNNLIVLTIRTLERVVHDPLVASLASSILRSMESAIARESALEAMRKHTGDIERIREKMLKAPPPPSAAAPEQTPVSSAETRKSSSSSQRTDAAFNWGQWRERVCANVHAASLIATDGQHLSMDEVAPFVDDFQATLRIISINKRTDMNANTMIEFFRMVSCAARVFESPGVTKPFLPLLNKVMFAIDDVVLLRGKFSNLRGHSQDLLAIRRRATQAHEDAERERERHHAEAERAAPSKPKSGGAVSNDKESMRFEALVSIADELMALPLSERRGRVSNYVFALQKELKLVFPTKGQRSTPSRTAYEAIVDAVKKAIELVQDEPHNEQNDTFFKQFLELLFTIGGRYNMFKQVVVRSRDDLYLYLYPDATTPMNPSGSKSTDTTTTSTTSSSKHSEEVSLREQLQSAYKKAHSWDHDVFSLKEFDDVMRVLRGVMGADSKSWRVRRDRTVADCLALMAQRALAIKKKEHREGRLASLAQWQKQMERGGR